ncbi:YgaP family membrane protein [Hymenobacter swuensis]|nr:DUF2892 domain-containing protein [Hymenobacter swuensis]
MQQNVGSLERGIRILLGATLAALLVGRNLLPPALQLWVAALVVPVALVLLGTGILGYCPLYALFGLNTHHPPRV